MAQKFGGSWTRKKLDVLEKYLRAYLLALRKRHFSLGYVDAFAGDGSVQLVSSNKETASEVEELIKGSAQRALALEPGFNGYVFIEKDETAAKKLEELRQVFPNKRILIIKGDANERVKRICTSHSWGKRRAVVFLDPKGLQVDWSTMEAIAITQAIDVWIWFPLGIGVNRLLTKSGEINLSWQESLDRIFGTTEWRSSFYSLKKNYTLFGEEERTVKTITPEGIADFYIKRLKSIFPAVASKPAVLYNSRNNPIYLLCFASANPGRGGKIAVKIAQHLLNNV